MRFIGRFFWRIIKFEVVRIIDWIIFRCLFDGSIRFGIYLVII